MHTGFVNGICIVMLTCNLCTGNRYYISVVLDLTVGIIFALGNIEVLNIIEIVQSYLDTVGSYRRCKVCYIKCNDILTAISHSDPCGKVSALGHLIHKHTVNGIFLDKYI